jgi:hypothetical protein
MDPTADDDTRAESFSLAGPPEFPARHQDMLSVTPGFKVLKPGMGRI